MSRRLRTTTATLASTTPLRHTSPRATVAVLRTKRCNSCFGRWRSLRTVRLDERVAQCCAERRSDAGQAPDQARRFDAVRDTGRAVVWGRLLPEGATARLQ